MHLPPYRALALAASISCLIQSAAGHSWVERLTLIAPNGTFVGAPGYPRGNVQRTAPGFSDNTMTYLLPPNERADHKLLASDKICMETQRTQNQTEGSPRLQATPGAAIALRYQENGHVSLPETQAGKGPNRGAVYVYGTTDPRPDDALLSIHKVWNRNGTGGDGRGMLLSQQYFDDGRCYQINDGNISQHRQVEFAHKANKVMGADLWCQQDIALPENVPVDNPYTLYWVWDWPTAPNVDPSIPDGKPEIYTTCMDIDVSPEKKVDAVVKAAGDNVGYNHDQPLNKAAIPSQVAGLNQGMRIPDSRVSTTFATKTGPAFNPTKTDPSNVVTTSVDGCPAPQPSDPTTTTLPVLLPISTGAIPDKPTTTFAVKAFRFHRTGARLPRAVAPTDTAYEEYKRQTTSPENNNNIHDSSSDDFKPSAYR